MGILCQQGHGLSPLLKSTSDDVNQTLEGSCYEAQLKKTVLPQGPEAAFLLLCLG